MSSKEESQRVSSIDDPDNSSFLFPTPLSERKPKPLKSPTDAIAHHSPPLPATTVTESPPEKEVTWKRITEPAHTDEGDKLDRKNSSRNLVRTRSVLPRSDSKRTSLTLTQPVGSPVAKKSSG
jgi:hypothetical protein